MKLTLSLAFFLAPFFLALGFANLFFGGVAAQAGPSVSTADSPVPCSTSTLTYEEFRRLPDGGWQASVHGQVSTSFDGGQWTRPVDSTFEAQDATFKACLDTWNNLALPLAKATYCQ